MQTRRSRWKRSALVWWHRHCRQNSLRWWWCMVVWDEFYDDDDDGNNIAIVTYLYHYHPACEYTWKRDRENERYMGFVVVMMLNVRVFQFWYNNFIWGIRKVFVFCTCILVLYLLTNLMVASHLVTWFHFIAFQSVSGYYVFVSLLCLE